MKKFISFIALAFFSFCIHAADFKEGTHYTVLEAPHSKSQTVTEYFSFYCPHCFQFESIVKGLKAKLPKSAKFEKVHVAFMGRNMAVPMAKAYATMVALDIEDKMVPVMFKQLHQLRNPPKTEQDLRQIFIDNGVKAEKYDAMYNSFIVNSMQRKFDKQFNNSTLTGVPGVIVNNKYIVKSESIKTPEQYSDLVNYLLTL